MKRSKDYYHNRRQLKELKHEKQTFKPSMEDVETWFVILNEQLFGNKLENFGSIELIRHRKFHALFHYETRKLNKPTMLSINRIFDNKKLFVEILAHEMVHLFQYQYNEPLGHGPSFQVWRDNFKFKGLTLYRVA